MANDRHSDERLEICKESQADMKDRMRANDECHQQIKTTLTDIQKTLVELKPFLQKVDMQQVLLFGADNQSGLVHEHRDVKRRLEKFDKAVAAVGAVLLTNVGAICIWAWRAFFSAGSTSSNSQ